MAEAIEEYGIAKQIGYHTGDNATSNDTCLKHLSQMLQDKYGISFHPNQRRIRCIAHIINLSLQAFLLTSSKEALRAVLAAASDVTGVEMYEQPYFTLYDVSTNEPTSRSEASGQQEQSFSKVWKGKAKRAARKLPGFKDDKFRGWQTIPAMHKLHNIAIWLRNSSIYSDLWEDREYYSKPEAFDRRILHSIEMGWFILDKYYTMTEDAPVYAAALLLDPSKRIMYIQRHWPESWHGNAIAGVHTIWEEEYKTQPETGPAESVDEVSASQKRQPNEWDALLEELEVTEDLGDSMDDLEDFIKATPIKISGSPLQWWCHKDQRKTYPQLSRMAIDILSIAPESADPESAFSGGRRTLSWDRERMTCENLEKVKCIGNWLREGHIQKVAHGGMGRVISQYASLVMNTLANSVPSERSFSAINFIHTKARNRLTPMHTEMQAFIFMNDRVLDRLKDQKYANNKRWADLEEKDWLELEDSYLELFVNAQGKKVWMDGVVASTSGDFEWEGVLQSTGDILGVGTEVESEV
ncbi:hypothetical protein FOTG_16751 [Fusarium oxysporum f. sp. vasinfectum 25433]|uniref:HAT C-terminal dimerisation domain-containing protein n=1 Tax=Fusarium oxysporum f. sp. vasinfectum 25433 TaxID=1089449 RepID=X0KMV9_FUSOX|nr:hypothetical protein FOTG_16751 [Fusarium oxysporum f. sp. vasinfectum 25433]